MIRKLVLMVFLSLAAGGESLAIEGMGNPWETIDDAVCAGLKITDFSYDVGAAVTIKISERVPETNSLPGYCRVVANIAP